MKLAKKEFYLSHLYLLDFHKSYYNNFGRHSCFDIENDIYPSIVF